MIRTVFKLECHNALQQGVDALYPALFFTLVIFLISLALGDDRHLLQQSAPAVILVAMLLSQLLSSHLLFEVDHAHAMLDEYLLSPIPLPGLMAVKLLCRWLTSAAPLICLAPPIASALQLSAAVCWAVFGVLCLSTPIVTGVMAMVSALMVSLQGRHLLLPLLVLPLLLPVLILGVSAVDLVAHGQSAARPLYLLAAGVCLLICSAPFAVSNALKLGV